MSRKMCATKMRLAGDVCQICCAAYQCLGHNEKGAGTFPHLQMWKSARKTVKHKLADQMVELKYDRSLFARMWIVARSRPEINMKEIIGQHELTSFP